MLPDRNQTRCFQLGIPKSVALVHYITIIDRPRIQNTDLREYDDKWIYSKQITSFTTGKERTLPLEEISKKPNVLELVAHDYISCLESIY